jgi:prevent-host-death family protein
MMRRITPAGSRNISLPAFRLTWPTHLVMIKSMKSYSVAEAKVRLSEILEEVSSGKEVVLTKRGKPVARVIPMERTSILGDGEHDGNINTPVLERDTWWKPMSGAEARHWYR